jgi:hypothetical protein
MDPEYGLLRAQTLRGIQISQRAAVIVEDHTEPAGSARRSSERGGNNLWCACSSVLRPDVAGGAGWPEEPESSSSLSRPRHRLGDVSFPSQPGPARWPQPLMKIVPGEQPFWLSWRCFTTTVNWRRPSLRLYCLEAFTRRLVCVSLLEFLDKPFAFEFNAAGFDSALSGAQLAPGTAPTSDFARSCFSIWTRSLRCTP